MFATPYRIEKRALRQELAAMPPFRRTAGAATKQRIRATLLRRAHGLQMAPGIR